MIGHTQEKSGEGVPMILINSYDLSHIFTLCKSNVTQNRKCSKNSFKLLFF